MAGKVTKEMGLIDIVQNHPEALEVFAKYGAKEIRTPIFEAVSAVLLQDSKILKQAQKYTA